MTASRATESFSVQFGCACVCCILTDATRRDTAVVFIGCFVVSIVGDRSCFGLVRVRVKGPGFVHLLASFVVRDERTA